MNLNNRKTLMDLKNAKDQDRIFQNLYNDLGADLASSQKRGDWSIKRNNREGQRLDNKRN